MPQEGIPIDNCSSRVGNLRCHILGRFSGQLASPAWTHPCEVATLRHPGPSPPTPPSCRDDPLSIDWVDMATIGAAKSPEGKSYSTEPRVGEATNRKRYFVKGPDPAVVAAESLAYLVAQRVGLDVPEWALTIVDGSLCFASEACELQSGVAALLQLRGGANPMFWPRVVAFDMWIANHDRDDGNVVARVLRNRVRQFLAIDFEKANLLRGQSLISVNMLESSHFMPRGRLATIRVRRQDVLVAAQSIRATGGGAINEVFAMISAEAALRGIVAETIGANLRRRAENVVDLCSEVYNA
jgi:hypothetical protein